MQSECIITMHSIRFRLHSSFLAGISLITLIVSLVPPVSLGNLVPEAQAQTTGLIAHWKFDEVSGTTATDSSGNNNAGILTNGPTWTTGKIGGAVSFDGVDDYVNTADIDFATGNFTLSAWFKTSALKNQRILSKESAADNQIWLMVLDDGTLEAGIYDGMGWQIATDPSSRSNNAWHHVAVDVTTTNIFLYVDGVQVGSATHDNSFSVNNATWNIGRLNSGGEYFNGSIDDVRIYSRALTAVDVQALYNLGGSPPPLDTTVPSQPTNLTATPVSSSQINLSWTASTDNVGVTGYRVERCQGSSCTNFIQIATPSGTSYSDTGLTANTTYRYQVRATDAAGNPSSYSIIATATTSSASSGTITLALQPTQTHQTFQAWRAEATGPDWPNYATSALDSKRISSTLLSQMLDELVYDLGLTGIRISVPSDRGIEITNDNSDPFVINWAGFDFNKSYSFGTEEYFDPPALLNQVVLPLKQRVESQGNSFSSYLSFGYTRSETPAHWANPDEYAEMMEAYLTHLKNTYNFTPTSWAVYNEPDLNSFTTTEVINNIVKAGPRIASKGFATKFQYPETERPDTGTSWMSAMLSNPSATPYLGMVSFHSYDYNSSDAPASFTSRNTLRTQAQQLSLPTGSTEICCKYGFSWNGSYKHGLEIARDIYFNLTEANASVWEPLGMAFPCNTLGCPSGSGGGGDIIVLDADVNRYFKLANYYTQRQYSKYIRPGYTRIGLSCSGCTTTSSGQNVKPVVFKSPSGTYVAVVINDETTSQSIDLAGFPAGTYQITGVDAANTQGRTYPDQIISTSQSLALTIPAQGLVTFVQTPTAPDTTAPSQPTNLTATPVSSSQINLSWTASTDDVGVTGYRVERCQGASCTNFVQVSIPSGITHNDTGLNANTTYRYQVRATDAAGNLSSYSLIANATTQSPPSGNALANLAASMAAGEWRELVTSNIGVLNQPGTDGNILPYGADAAWDPNTQKLMYVGNDHIDSITSQNLRSVIYDAPTNTWQNLATPPWGGPGVTDHGYYHHAVNPATGAVYRRGTKSGFQWYQYNITANSWTTVPVNNVGEYDGACCAGADYFPELGGLVYAQGGEFGGGTVYLFNTSTQQWSKLADNLAPMTGGTFTIGAYNPVQRVIVFGQNNAFYKIDSAYTVTNLANPPITLYDGGGYFTNLVADPVSGKYLVLTTTSRQFYTYDAATDMWQTQASTNKPDFTNASIISSPISNYGVVMYTACWASTCRAYLYKHATGTLPPPDTTPPTPPTALTATSISSSQINLSWTESTDDVGVTGYRAERCQGASCTNFVQVATSTTNSSSDTGLTANTTYVYRVRATDAAGNLSGYSTTASATTQAEVSTKFSINDRVQTTASLNARSCASTSCSLLGTQPTGIQGTVIGGPTLADGFWWWNINYDSGADGWSVEDYLVKVTSGGSDFATRCSQPGVIKCVGFDASADIQGTWGDRHGTLPGDAIPALDVALKASGASSLKFTIPSNSGANSSGSYFTNFSDDLSTQFGANSDFYIQWRQRFSPEFLNTLYQGGGGWKQSIIGSGDKARCTSSNTTNCTTSCTTLETVTQNTNQRGFPQMYNSCSGSASHGPYDPFSEPFGAYDFKLENAMPTPYCLYSQNWSLGTPANPPGNCFVYQSNEWMTFQVHIHTGNFVTDEWQNSHVDMWVAREGQPAMQVFNYGPTALSAGTQGELFGKVWFLPYHTGKDPAQIHPTAYTWYDELIISRNKIADPGGTSPTFDFSVTNGGNKSVTQGSSVTNTITASLVPGSSQPVSFSTSGLPAGTTYTYSPTSCIPTCTTTKTITASASTPTGSYPITITATGGGLTRTTTFTLTVSSIPTLSVNLTANPSSGTAPLNGVDLTATVSGTESGNINYTFYCNRSDTGTNITTPHAGKFDNQTLTTYTATDICNYSTPNTYTAKVIAERGTLVSQSQVVITVFTPPASTKFQMNDRVQTTANLNVRSCAGTSCSLLGTQPSDALGIIIGGPTYANGTTPAWWWQVNYDNAPDGWSVEDYLVKVSPSPTPTPTPSPSPSPLPSPTSTPTPPPTAVSCHLYTPGSTIPAGYGVPWDVLSANEMLIKATCLNTTDARIDYGRGISTQYIYKTGYHYHAGMTNWSPITLSSPESLVSSNWYPKTASGSLSGLDLTNTTHYVLGHICTWNGSTWKCGCRDSACMQSYWQVQSFKR